MSCVEKESEHSAGATALESDTSTVVLEGRAKFTLSYEDSIAIDASWNSFKKNLFEEDKEALLETLVFPISGFDIMKFKGKCLTKDDRMNIMHIDKKTIFKEEAYNYLLGDTIFKRTMKAIGTKDIFSRGLGNNEGMNFPISANILEGECDPRSGIWMSVVRDTDNWKVRIGIPNAYKKSIP